jgi:hypothetical protein
MALLAAAEVRTSVDTASATMPVLIYAVAAFLATTLVASIGAQGMLFAPGTL